MPNLDALNTAIAVVIVLLLLSLIVQSVQAILKKLIKIKSRQLEQSLVDLFEHVLADRGTPVAADPAATPKKSLLKSPLLQLLIPRGKHASELAVPEVKVLYQAVVTRFKEIGRVSVAGKAMLDSISKEDLLKVLRSVAPGTLLPNLVSELSEACNRVNSLKTTLQEIKVEHLEGEASAKFAAMHDALAPTLSDIQSLMSGEQVNPKLLLGDVMSLRQIKLDEALKLLGEVQSKVQLDIEAEEAKSGSTKVDDLKAVSEGLNTIAATIIQVREKFDSALAPLRVKLTEVEVWYDTVMQSFNERYARSMKTWAVVISFVVVVFLNANFFNIYKNISVNDVTRNLLLEAGPELLARSKAAQGGADTTTTGQPADKQTPEQIIASVQELRKQLKNDVDTYASLGFAPSKWGDFRAWLTTLWPPPEVKDAGGVVIAKSGDLWLNQRKTDLRTLLGWIITALLLSVGAPFWQDTLESLFGVKNLLRQRGGQKNVETESGAGQPKP